MGVIQRTIDYIKYGCYHVWSLNGNNGEFAVWKCDKCNQFVTGRDLNESIK